MFSTSDLDCLVDLAYVSLNCLYVLCRYLASLRGHVQRVYQVAWSADSRLLCSGSADSTLKVWDVTAKKLLYDLPGHADEVRGHVVTSHLFI